MTRFVVCLFCVISGIIGGVLMCAAYMHTYYNLSSHRSDLDEMVVPIPRILNYSEKVLSPENFHCDNEDPNIGNHNVGNIVTDIFVTAATDKSTKLSYKCDFEQHRCRLSVSTCHTWQTMECGSRALTFGITDKLEIIPDSFECIEIP